MSLKTRLKARFGIANEQDLAVNAAEDAAAEENRRLNREWQMAKDAHVASGKSLFTTAIGEDGYATYVGPTRPQMVTAADYMPKSEEDSPSGMG